MVRTGKAQLCKVHSTLHLWKQVRFSNDTFLVNIFSYPLQTTLGLPGRELALIAIGNSGAVESRSHLEQIQTTRLNSE